MVKADYGDDVKTFLTTALAAWVPFFVAKLDEQIHETINEQDYQGLITLKIQIIRVSKLSHLGCPEC